MRYLYFAYGMNTNTLGMSQRCPQARDLGAARLQGWRLVFNTHADIERDPKSEAWGVLWSITDSDLASLDRLEGYPTYYDMIQVLVEQDHGTVPSISAAEDEAHWAMVYIMNRRPRDYAPPPAHYWEMLTQGYQEHGLPNSQLQEALQLAQGDTWDEWDAWEPRSERTIKYY